MIDILINIIVTKVDFYKLEKIEIPIKYQLNLSDSCKVDLKYVGT